MQWQYQSSSADQRLPHPPHPPHPPRPGREANNKRVLDSAITPVSVAPSGEEARSTPGMQSQYQSNSADHRSAHQDHQAHQSHPGCEVSNERTSDSDATTLASFAPSSKRASSTHGDLDLSHDFGARPSPHIDDGHVDELSRELYDSDTHSHANGDGDSDRETVRLKAAKRKFPIECAADGYLSSTCPSKSESDEDAIDHVQRFHTFLPLVAVFCHCVQDGHSKYDCCLLTGCTWFFSTSDRGKMDPNWTPGNFIDLAHNYGTPPSWTKDVASFVLARRAVRDPLNHWKYDQFMRWLNGQDSDLLSKALVRPVSAVEVHYSDRGSLLCPLFRKIAVSLMT
jgi:hypothetical protein